jgi:hypothetical protein
VLEDSTRHRDLRLAARGKAEREYELQLQARRYQSVLKKMLDRVQPTLIG